MIIPVPLFTRLSSESLIKNVKTLNRVTGLVLFQKKKFCTWVLIV